MTYFDYIILVIFVLGMLAIGGLLSRWNKSTEDMFAVCRQSPWWLSGISAFMSAFSAGTFVVWGGVAYKHGLVSVSILMCLGVSSFIVGKYFAGRWASLGVTTVGEYIRLRFSESVVQFYTWVGMAMKLVSMSVALYAFATLFCTFVPLSEGHFFSDPSTGHFSIIWACVISGILMLFYTVSGGLWAVLIIDAVQFIILSVTVLFVVPSVMSAAGGVSGFLAAAPEGFLAPAGGQFSYLFLLGWIAIHVFRFGGEWVFVQRLLAVNSPQAARKSSYLLGALYLICPIIWMLPAMVYRTINPGADPEQAYFMACSEMLPAGLIGLMMASMFSAAASSIGGEINVYAGALTHDFYKALRPKAGTKELLVVGRLSSFMIGALIIGGAVLIPHIGGAEKVIITMMSLLAVPLALPSVWGLIFKRVSTIALWTATGLSVLAAVVLRFVPSAIFDEDILLWLGANSNAIEVGVGIFIPVLTLTLFEIFSTRESDGYDRVRKFVSKNAAQPRPLVIAAYPARILAYSIGAIALLFFLIAGMMENREGLALGFAIALALMSAAIFIISYKKQ